MRAFETEKTEVAEIDRSVYDIKDKVNAAFEVNSGLTAEIVEKISEEKHAAYIGKTVRCLVDGRDDKGLTARTPGNRLVRLTGDEGLIGQFVDVKITGANKWSLSGEPA